VIALRPAVPARTIDGMFKGRGKGRISNDLVAASCAAVLAVYAAGYSRTRDAARRFEIHSRERRAVAPEPVAASPQPAADIEIPTAPSPSAITPAPRRPAPPAVRKQARKAAVVVMTADAVATTEGASSPNAPREIAPVPLPAEDTTGPTPIAITRETSSVTATKWRDGTYTGLGDSPHGDIEARVVIKDGRIVEAGIATCDTRYPCSVIDPLIHQPVERQSPDVDYMSHATESSDAYYNALVAALDSALERPSNEATIPK
jgi:uncharacterized protein with FMN-binding domain